MTRITNDAKINRQVLQAEEIQYKGPEWMKVESLECLWNEEGPLSFERKGVKKDES